MQPTNFCRQMKRQFTAALAEGRPPESARVLSHCIDLCDGSQKFSLPDGGILIEDREYRALRGVPLRLPFKFIALEYERSREEPPSYGYTRCPKAIVFARERDDLIIVSPVAWIAKEQVWGPLPEVALKATDYFAEGTTDGWQNFKFYNMNSPLPAGDYLDELSVLLSFLNALACANVQTDTLRRRKAKKPKACLSFDTYHVLVIDGAGSGEHRTGHRIASRRGPREHLRRGHIRKLQNGKCLWVNATVVGAGRRGKVRKEYAVKDT